MKTWTKEEIEQRAKANTEGKMSTEGAGYIYGDYKEFADLDGTEARKYLESKGFKVVKNYDTGNNGVAITECGLCLSTNGWVWYRQ